MMNSAQLATASLNDIVFDGRNKEYGAYELRGLYERHVLRAMVLASLLLLLLISFPLIARLVKDRFPAPVVKISGPLELIDVVVDPGRVVVPPPIAPPVTPPATQQRASTVEFKPPVVTRDELAAGTVASQEDLATTDPGAVTFHGNDNPPLVPTDLPPGNPTIGETVAPSAPYTYVEQMPSLPGGGGMEAVVAAIQKAVKYPQLAVRNGVEGRMFASFVVNARGEVSDIKIVKGLGSGLDEEVVRAINTLPKFIPGKQNGREVSVAFTVPLTFKIQ
jgi:protein TonB